MNIRIIDKDALKKIDENKRNTIIQTLNALEKDIPRVLTLKFYEAIQPYKESHKDLYDHCITTITLLKYIATDALRAVITCDPKERDIPIDWEELYKIFEMLNSRIGFLSNLVARIIGDEKVDEIWKNMLEEYAKKKTEECVTSEDQPYEKNESAQDALWNQG